MNKRIKKKIVNEARRSTILDLAIVLQSSIYGMDYPHTSECLSALEKKDVRRFAKFMMTLQESDEYCMAFPSRFLIELLEKEFRPNRARTAYLSHNGFEAWSEYIFEKD